MNTDSNVLVLQESYQNNATKPYHYNSVYRSLICKKHGYAVASWRRPLSDDHAFSKTDIKDIGRVLQHLDVVRLEDATVPAPHGPPVQYLQPSRIGFECRGQVQVIAVRYPFLDP